MLYDKLMDYRLYILSHMQLSQQMVESHKWGQGHEIPSFQLHFSWTGQKEPPKSLSHTLRFTGIEPQDVVIPIQLPTYTQHHQSKGKGKPSQDKINMYARFRNMQVQKYNGFTKALYKMCDPLWERQNYYRFSAVHVYIAR